jgi:hypothetical protein
VRGSPSRDTGRRAGKSAWHWLLVVPFVVPLAIPLFNRLEPRLFGFPFFYWGQLAAIGFAMVVTTAVYLLTKRER